MSLGVRLLSVERKITARLAYLQHNMENRAHARLIGTAENGTFYIIKSYQHLDSKIIWVRIKTHTRTFFIPLAQFKRKYVVWKHTHFRSNAKTIHAKLCGKKRGQKKYLQRNRAHPKTAVNRILFRLSSCRQQIGTLIYFIVIFSKWVSSTGNLTRQ